MSNQMTVENIENTKTQKVQGILPVDVYLVSFTNAEGKGDVRLVFQPRNSKAVFNLQETIAGKKVATAASEWFSKEFNEKLEVSGGVEQA
jgi:septum formation inhibitor-activating ATPase MinD